MSRDNNVHSPGGQGDARALIQRYDAAGAKFRESLMDDHYSDAQRVGFRQELAAVQDELIAALAARQPVGEPVADAGRSAAYDAIDRFLRNNMDDVAYAVHEEHLETLFAFGGTDLSNEELEALPKGRPVGVDSGLEEDRMIWKPKAIPAAGAFLPSEWYARMRFERSVELLNPEI